MVYNILIVEDDVTLSTGITLALKRADFNFIEASSLGDARQAMKKNKFELILLDINLPDGNGLDFLREIRATSSIPIIMLTANDTETDIVTGLELGANDYVTKPFSLMVLRARVNAQLRNTEFVQKDYSIDTFYFNFHAMVFKKGERTIELSKTELKLLKVLVENKGNVLSREALVDKIWTDGAEYVDENALSVTIKRLRDKLEEVPSKPEYIKTVYGIGYSWVEK